MGSSTSETNTGIPSGAIICGRYRVVRPIGNGGMGAVYEVIDEHLDIRMALKHSHARETELKRQFEREARLLASLKHDALPRVVDYFVEGDQAFLVMDFVEGQSLSEVVKNENGPLPVREVVALADQILGVLVYLHDQGRRIVHRDIKPQHLLLRSDGRISLLDFGLAKCGREDDDVSGDDCSVHGYSPRFSSIEQIRALGTTERSDIYSLGATLYFLLTGVRPDDAEKRAEVLRGAGVDCLRRADYVVPAVGEDLALIIERAMAVEGKDRFQNASDFRAALGQLGRVPVDEKTKASRVVSRNQKSRPRTLAVAVSMLVLIGLVLISAALVVREQADKSAIESAAPQARDVGVPGGKAADATPKAKSKSADSGRASPTKLAHETTSRPEEQRKGDRPVKDSQTVKQQSQVARVVERKQPAKITLPPVRSVQAARSNVTKREAAPASEVMRAPDGTEVVRFKDGRLHVSDRGSVRQ